jgi:RNA polymerase-binding transcription factor DksA
MQDRFQRGAFAMKRTSRHGDSMSAKRLKKFKRLLLAKRNKALHPAAFRSEDKPCCARSGPSEMPTHVIDPADDSSDSKTANRFTDADKRLLARVEDALAKIDAGTYGICDGDGELIAKSRLEMVPWTRYCAKCARLAQMGLLSSEDSCEGPGSTGAVF